MRRLPPIDTIRTFVEIADQGRFNRASEALGLTESAISHRLRKLEDALGVRLLDRQREGAVLTPAGERFYDKAAKALALLADAVEEVQGIDRKAVSITTSRAFAAHWLMPRYRAFLDRHPGIELQLLVTERVCDLAREHIDLAIRYGDGPWPGLEAVRLSDEVCFPVATPALARAWRELPWPDAVERAGRIIVNALHPDEWSAWCAISDRRPPDPSRCSTLESFDLVLQAALSGAGLAMGRRPMVDDCLERGDLVAPFGTDGVRGKSYFLVWPREGAVSGSARSVRQWLASSAELAADGGGGLAG